MTEGSDAIQCCIGALQDAGVKLYTQFRACDGNDRTAINDAQNALRDIIADLTAALHAAEEREGDVPTERQRRDMRMSWSNLDGSRG